MSAFVRACDSDTGRHVLVYVSHSLLVSVCDFTRFTSLMSFSLIVVTLILLRRTAPMKIAKYHAIWALTTARFKEAQTS